MKRARPFAPDSARESVAVPVGVRVPAPARGGVTLVEVLMSVMVLGIGVLSVVALFPISFLRSVQATNLTNSTILRYNAEAQLDLNRLLIDGVPRWEPAKPYNAGDLVVASSVVTVNPQADNRLYRATNAGTSSADPVPGQPTWQIVLGSTTNDPGATPIDWETLDHSVYVVDPLGWNLVDPLNWDALGTALQNNFGNDGGTADPTVRRFHAGFLGVDFPSSVQIAARGVTLPDSWIHITDGIVDAGTLTGTSAQLPGQDLSDLAFVDPQSRVVLLDITGRNSVIRLITAVTDPVVAGVFDTVNWADPLPAGFTPASARVETQERRYTWMLTARRDESGIVNADVVVFFRRSFEAENEQIFDAAQLNQRSYTLSGPVEALKKGSFLFDVDNGRWYRAQAVVDQDTAAPTVQLDRDAPGTLTRVIVMRSIVDVYPIATRDQ